MDGNNSYNIYPAQPPKKRKSGADYEERETKPDLDNLNISTPPKSNASHSQDSPLDFSVKNGNDSVSPPSVISPPSTLSSPSARSPPSATPSPPVTSSPVSPPVRCFSTSDFEMRGKNMIGRISHNVRDQVVDYSDSGQSPETFNPCRPKVSVVNPTVHMQNEENSHKVTSVPNLPLPSFGKFIQSPRNSYDATMKVGNSEIGFGSASKEYGSHSKKYDSGVNGFGQSIPSEALCSANMASYNPYLGMLPGSFGAGIMNGQGGILASAGGLLGGQSGLLSAQGGLLSSQVGLLNGQGGLLGNQGGLLNGHAYKYGSTETNGDKKISKTARPFKIYEQEILNYPFQNCPTMIPQRFQEIPQQPTTTFSPADRSRNESPPHQQSNSSSRLSNASIEVQRDTSDCFSDESQNSNNPQQGSEGNGSRRKGQKYPDEKKDAAYFEKRRKNNLAAKRSRDARRLKEDAIATRARNLVQENTLLRMKLAEFQTINLRLEAELSGFKRAAYDQRSEIDKLKDEVERLSRGFAFNHGSRTCDRSESPGL